MPGERSSKAVVPTRYQSSTGAVLWVVATNLRLRPAAEEALRAASERTGRSQQDLIRDAVDQYLDSERAPRQTDLDQLIAAGLVIPSRTPYRRATTTIRLPAGVTSTDLLDRDDRF